MARAWKQSFLAGKVPDMKYRQLDAKRRHIRQSHRPDRRRRRYKMAINKIIHLYANRARA